MARKFLSAIAAAGLACCCCVVAAGSAHGQTTAAPETPVVEQTEPACWAREVPVETKELEVVLDAPLASPRAGARTPPPLVFSAHPAAALPTLTGEARVSADGRTLALPVKLEPGRVYVVPLLPGPAAAPGPVTPPKPGAAAAAQFDPPARFVVFQTTGDSRPEQEPPKIVGIELRQPPPPAGPGSRDQPPLTQLRVSFDRDLNPATHGFILTQGDDPVPLAAGQVSYDKKARVWQATFLARPGIVTVRLNSESNVGFRAADPVKIPAWPVQLSFQIPFQGSVRQTAAAVRTSED